MATPSIALTDLATELIHLIALSGYLTFPDVVSLALTCKSLCSVLVGDSYGRDLHYALRGVLPNVGERKWRSASYALTRSWFSDPVCACGCILWYELVVDAVENAFEKGVFYTETQDIKGWEKLMLASLSHPKAHGWESSESHSFPPSIPGIEFMGVEFHFHVHCNACNATALIAAASAMGAAEIIKWGAKEGLDVNRHFHEMPPLFIATMFQQVDVVEALVENGADVDAVGMKGSTPLAMAALGKSLAMVRILVKGGADMEKSDDSGSTPLLFAALTNSVEIVRFLLDAGASPTIVTLQAAFQKGHDQVVCMLATALISRGVTW